MNTAKFLALCESDPSEMNCIVAEAAGWTDLEESATRRPIGKSPAGEIGTAPDYVGSLDAAWTLEDWVESHADGIFILAKRHGINPAKPRNAATLFCAAFLQARDRLRP